MHMTMMSPCYHSLFICMCTVQPLDDILDFSVLEAVIVCVQGVAVRSALLSSGSCKCVGSIHQASLWAVGD